MKENKEIMQEAVIFALESLTANPLSHHAIGGYYGLHYEGLLRKIDSGQLTQGERWEMNHMVEIYQDEES